MPFAASSGFNLTELLIALTIVAEIATFTIPKVLVSQQNQKWNAAAKEAISMIAASYDLYKARNGARSTVEPSYLTPYMNFVKQDMGDMDEIPGSAYINCSNTGRGCYTLHNGGTLVADPGTSFGGTLRTNAIYFLFDPNPSDVAISDYSGPSKSLEIILYYNGRITTYENRAAGTRSSDGNIHASGGWGDPDWFNW